MIKYAIQDENGCFADKNSLFVDKEGKVRYVPSEDLLNGCCYFSNYEIATKHLEQLQHINKVHNGNRKFKISQIIK